MRKQNLAFEPQPPGEPKEILEPEWSIEEAEQQRHERIRLERENAWEKNQRLVNSYDLKKFVL